jgi:tRNA 2-thiouridine synthesizing protein A
VNFDKELDNSGLSCPLPILKAKKVFNEMAREQLLKIIATDPGAVKDMQSFSRQTGHPLLSSTEEGSSFVFLLQKR